MQDVLPPPVGAILTARQFGSIRFVPDQGTVLWCDLRDVPPAEMGGKIRPVVVVSPHLFNVDTVYVAPITRAAHLAKPWDVHIPADRYDFFDPGHERWVKTHFVRPVHRSRLDRMRVSGRWCSPHISGDDLRRILAAINTIFAAAQHAA